MDAEENCQCDYCKDDGEPLIDLVSDYDIRVKALELAVEACRPSVMTHAIVQYANEFFAFLTAGDVRVEAPRADA